MTGLTFLIMFLILMALVAVVPDMLRRFHIPRVVSIMLVGIIIGPNSLDLLGQLGRFLGRGYPTEDIYAVLDAMGMIGLVFLMALAGMEVSLRILMLERKAVILLSTLTFIVPAAAGYGVYAWFRPDDLIGKLVYASLFASHSVGIVFPVIRELNASRTRFGVAVLASTVITDIASLVLLAICIQMKRHAVPTGTVDSISIFDHIDATILGPWFVVLFVAVVAGYIALSLWLAPRIINPLLTRLHPGDDTRLTFFLLVVLLVVFAGELIGVSIIVGAFIAGMAVIRSPGFQTHGQILHQKIEGAGYGFVIPFLFLTIGMNTDPAILVSAWQNVAIVAATLVGLVVSKVASGWLAMRLAGFDHLKSLCAGLMTVPQLSATLAAAAVALELNMLEPQFFNAIVCLSVGTTIPAPTLVKLLITKYDIRFDSMGEDLAAVMAETPAEPQEDLL